MKEKYVYHEENGRPKYLQNYDKGLDMGKHTFILIIRIYSLHVIYVLLSFNKSKCALDNCKINKQTNNQ